MSDQAMIRISEEFVLFNAGFRKRFWQARLSLGFLLGIHCGKYHLLMSRFLIPKYSTQYNSANRTQLFYSLISWCSYANGYTYVFKINEGTACFP